MTSEQISSLVAIIVVFLFILFPIGGYYIHELIIYMGKRKRNKMKRKWLDDDFVIKQLDKNSANYIQNSINSDVIVRVLKNQSLSLNSLEEDKRTVIINKLMNYDSK